MEVVGMGEGTGFLGGETEEGFGDIICGPPLSAVLADPQFGKFPVAATAMYGRLKVRRAADEVLALSELNDTERANMAELMLAEIVAASEQHGAHAHQLAAALRRLAKSLA